MSNYLTQQIFFNTGYLKPEITGNLRVQQGLQPQNLSNMCLPSQVEKCNPTNMYNQKQSIIQYGGKPIPASCPCAQFVLPP